QQVGGNIVGIGCMVGNNEHLGWSSRHIDTYLGKALNQALGLRDVLIARSEYFINLRDRVCTVCHSGYGLSTAHQIDLVDLKQLQAVSNVSVDTTPRLRRRTNDDFFAASDTRRNTQH